MLKFAILFLAAVWGLGLIFGRRGRFIRDTNHLLQLIVWSVLVFMGLAVLPKVQELPDFLLLRVVLVAVWMAVCWPVSKLVLRLISK